MVFSMSHRLFRSVRVEIVVHYQTTSARIINEDMEAMEAWVPNRLQSQPDHTRPHLLQM
jgi:hypothetical protein